jgi:dipeptide/tripeptide permease
MMTDFQKYLTERYRFQVDWYDRKAIANHTRFNVLQGAIIIGSISAPILTTYFKDQWRWIPVCVSAAVSVLISCLAFLKYQEKWIRHRSTCEKLKREYYYYIASLYHYIGLDDAQRQAKFVQVVESIVANEQIEWLGEHAKEVKRVKEKS